MPGTLPNQGLQAFTLIEIVVAVVIISVLAVLAFTSAGRIAEKSKTTGCISNIRQIHMAFMGYAADNANVLPLAENKAENKAAWMSYLVNGGYLPPDPKGPITPRIKHPLVDPGSLVQSTVALTSGHYGVNRSLVGPAPTNTPNPQRLNLAAVSEPSKRLLLMCSGMYALTRNQANAGGGYLYLPGMPQNQSATQSPPFAADAKQGRHGRTVNALFLSGHVESLPPEELVRREEAWERN